MSVLMTDKVSVRGPAHFFQGDNRTQLVWFTVNRYRDGIDLAQLTWSIHIRNAEGTTDVAMPCENPDIRGDKIIIGWLVRGIATAAVGDLTFNLRGVAEDAEGNPIIWNSGDEKRPVYSSLTCTPSEEQETALSELDALIKYVGQELPELLEDARKTPYIGKNGNWWLWDIDLNQYYDTELPARGVSPSVTIEEIEGGHRVIITDAEGEKIFEVLDGVGGGGSGSGGSGGGTSNNAVMSLSNKTGWLAKTIALGAECVVTAEWSSLEDNMPTGNGVMSLSVGSSVKLTREIAQGAIVLDVSEWLSAGSNRVKLTVTDVYGNSRSVYFTINTIALSLTSDFDPTPAFSGPIQYIYVPTGDVEKTVHFVLDGTEIGTATVTASGREQTYNIPAQSHGSHTLRVWFTAEVDGETVPSNDLFYDLNCIVSGNTTINIMSAFRQTEAEQYALLSIDHQVYDPSNLTAAVTYWANGVKVSEGTVDRTVQTWNYRPTDIGDLTLEIKCGDTTKTFDLTVSESSVQIEAETQNLQLFLSSEGRSNIEDNPGVWKYGDIEATFTGFNWISDGWKQDEAKNTVLRVTGDARVEIPMQIFATDFRSSGKTIEIEFASRDVLDYNAMILSSVSGGRGIEITAQRADMHSEQSTIGTQYKEDEHVRLTFVTEKRSGNRLILIYLNGIISGIKQYPDNDDFSQATPVGISIGSNDCTIDLYNIRVYGNDLTRYQVLDNWIADTQDISERMERYERNLIYDAYGKVVKEQLPQYLPYMVIEGASLPQDKGDKKTISGYYVDPINDKKSFTFSGAEIDVQGTSSKDYYVKNFKIKFKGGFILNDGVKHDTYQLSAESVPTDTFTMKADVASSEGANNVELVRLYNDISPHRTPPQLTDPLVRQGIDGYPMVIFWDNGSTISFHGKYNFNHDKGTEEVFGFAAGDESWEIRNNVSDRVMFKSADFDDTSAATGWLNDFEGRYPDGNTDPTNLKAFAQWIVSTDRTAATGAAIDAVTYDGVEYTSDTAEYRLAKFKAELPNHADVTSAQFYWLFTEFFLMVDSRAKNAFPTRYAADGKWCWLPYDMDTAIGINNEGALAFGYSLEDTDLTESGAQVFNGQQSVFWNNVRDAFPDEIKQMYIDLRKDGKLTYADVIERFDAHQSAWPEAIMNEDAYRKYIEPYVVEGATMYFSMAQGKKELQRAWWLYNRFRYFDAKFDAGDIASDRILIRIYASADIPVVPYADTYLRSKYGSYAYDIRATAGEEYDLHCYVDAANDLETTIFPASLIAEIADLSALKIGLADFSKAIKLQVLKIGDGAEDYSNGNLTELTLGNNTLLKSLDVRNCPNLTMAVDLSGCTNIETVLFDGTSIAGVSLPNGGMVSTLHLPGTITNLTLLNQTKLTDFVLPSYSQITTLRLENPAEVVDTAAILAAIPEQSRVRLIGLDWDMYDAEAVLDLYDHLDTMKGLDEFGNNTDKAVVSGVLHIPALTGAQLAEMQSRYPYITIDYGTIISYCRFYNYDGTTLLYTAEVVNGADAVYFGSTPGRTTTAQYTYTFVGWSKSKNATSADADALTAVTTDRDVYAAFTANLRYYTVYFYNGSTLLQTVNNVPYGGSATYTGSTPTYTGSGDAADYEFTGFQPTGKGITGNTSCYAQFKYTGYLYTQLIDGSISGEYVDDQLTTVGAYAFYKCTNLTKIELPAVTTVADHAFFSMDNLKVVDLASVSRLNEAAIYYCNKLTTLILRNTDQVCDLYGTDNLLNTPIVNGYGYVYVPAALVDAYKADATFKYYASQIRAIEDYPDVWPKFAWETVDYHIQQGDYATFYSVGDLIPLDLGDEGLINMQIAAFDADDLSGGGKAHISFISKELLKTKHRWNPDLVTNDDGTYQEGTGTIGGWASSELRTYMSGTIMPKIPAEVRSMIKTVAKSQPYYTTAGTKDTQSTDDGVWIPSKDEISGASSLYYPLFKNTGNNRIKYIVGSTSATTWFLRTLEDKSYVCAVTGGGGVNQARVETPYGIALGFCV